MKRAEIQANQDGGVYTNLTFTSYAVYNCSLALVETQLRAYNVQRRSNIAEKPPQHPSARRNRDPRPMMPLREL